MKLKALNPEGNLDPDTCGIFRCTEPSTVMDDSQTFWPLRVPLCDAHWTARCAREIPVNEENVPMVDTVSKPVLPGLQRAQQRFEKGKKSNAPDS